MEQEEKVQSSLLSRIGIGIARAADLFKERSGREKALILVSVAFVLLFFAAKLNDSIQAAFAEQEQRLEKISEEIRGASGMLKDYAAKRARVREFENQFSDENPEGIMGYLESLLTAKTGLSLSAGHGSGYKIMERPPMLLVGTYNLYQYDIILWTSEFPKFIDFLQGVLEGDRPLIVSGLKLTRQGARMQAEIQISRIVRKGAEQTSEQAAEEERS